LADPGRPASVERAVSEAGSEVVVPFSVEAGEVILNVSINGRGPFPFILDSGAQDALTPETVAALGLKTEGTERFRTAAVTASRSPSPGWEQCALVTPR